MLTGENGLSTINTSELSGNVTNRTIPRRIKYPTSEYSVNSSNLAKALERQGRDVFTTRIWWDK
jgi:hypothetical protein